MMRVRARTLALCLGAAVCAVLVVGQAVSACVFDLGGDCASTLTCPDGGTSGSTSSGSTSTSTSTSSGSGGTGGTGCTSPADCQGPWPDAGVPSGAVCPAVATCNAGTCGLAYLPGDATDQPSGTCVKRVCNADGTVVTAEEDTNGYDAGNPCIVAQCDGGALTVTAEPDGTTCPPPSASSIQGRCMANYAGQISACTQCISALQDCKPGLDCSPGHYCVLGHCVDGLPNFDETDTDCGGADCSPCADGKKCLGPSDCQSGVCDVAGNCAAATCPDNVKNGGETDIDCGGPACARRCPTGRVCILPSDCASQVCAGGKCQPPTCSDGVQNGDETGVDCGSNDGGACDAGCPLP